MTLRTTIHPSLLATFATLGVLALPACGDDDTNSTAAGGSSTTTTSSSTTSSGGNGGNGGAGGSTTGTGGSTGGAGGMTGDGFRPIGPRPVTPTALSQGTLFASPTGSGTACSEASPCDVWEVVSQAMAGDVVFLRGGVYDIDQNLTFRGRGTSKAPIFESYPGELAILDGGSSGPGDQVYVRVVDDPMVIRLIEIRNFPQAGISVRSSDHVLEGLDVHHNLLSGIHVHESYTVPSSNRNLIRDCTVHDNSGVGHNTPTYADGGNSDGISMSSGIGNRVENCLVYGNSDDGVDTWRTTDSYVGYTIARGSGLGSGNGIGFKAGGAPPSATSHVEHCLSYNNRSAGFDYNSGVGVVFSYNTSSDNSSGYYGADDTTVMNNIAAESDPVGGNAIETNNSWQRSGTVMFLSLDPTAADFLKPGPGGFEDIGAYANREATP